MTYEKEGALAANIQHWSRFDHLRRDVGLAVLVGADPVEKNLEQLLSYNYRRMYGRQLEQYSPIFGFRMLDGELLGWCEFGASKEDIRNAKIEFEKLVDTFDLFYDYWDSGSHPETTPLSYFLAWAATKNLPDRFCIRSAAIAINRSASHIENGGATIISAQEISGPTFERLKKAIAAFPTKYPEYKTNPPKLGDDVRKWLCESKLAENQRDEAKVFSNIIAEHFQFSTDSRKTK